jgi:hypothetical protein
MENKLEELYSKLPPSPNYKELEKDKWLELQKDCDAFGTTILGHEYCGISSKECSINQCFSLKLIKLIRGFL